MVETTSQDAARYYTAHFWSLICSIQAGTFWTLGSRCTCTCSTRSWAHWVSAWFQRDVFYKEPIEKRGWSQSPYRRLYCKPKRSHWPSYMAGLNLPGLGRFSWTKHGMGIEWNWACKNGALVGFLDESLFKSWWIIQIFWKEWTIIGNYFRNYHGLPLKFRDWTPKNAPNFGAKNQARRGRRRSRSWSGGVWHAMGVLMMQLPRFGKNVQIQTDHTLWWTYKKQWKMAIEVN